MSTEMMSAEEMVREALREVIDPEIGVNIVDLGMVYEVEVEGESVEITMTLTTPACPLGPYIDAAVKEALEPVPGVTDVEVNLVWTPPWDPCHDVRRRQAGARFLVRASGCLRYRERQALVRSAENILELPPIQPSRTVP